MKGQEFDASDIHFYGPFAPQVEKTRRPFGCPFHGHGQHDHKPGYVPFGPHGFAFGPEDHGHHYWPNHHRRGPSEDGHRRPGCGRWGPPKFDWNGPSEHRFYGPPGFRPGQDGRPHDFHGHGPSGHKFGAQPWWFGRGPSDADRPWTGPWGGPDQRRF